MKQIYICCTLLLFAVLPVFAQTTILDFETPATSTGFQYFGSSLDGTLNQVIANPNATGINTSAMVGKFVKPAVAEVWAGAFSNPNPTAIVDLSANNKISVKVHMDHIGSLSLKLEGSANGGNNWLVTVPNTKVNEWEELVFDASLPSLEPPNTPASGFSYTRVVLFFDFGVAGSGTDVTSYFDDITALPNTVASTTILDFETPETSTAFQYFGSPLDGSLNSVVDNPNPSGIDTSSKVGQFIKPGVAEVWAGAFSNPNPTTPIDLPANGQVCVKVHMSHVGNLAIKLEGSATGKPNWITKVPNTKINEWEELCFDASLPSLEPPFEAASGVYTRLVLFFDFGTPGSGTADTSYFDDVKVKGGTVQQLRTINFQVDMNNYTANFDKVYLSGSFNNWSGDATPLEDANFDGIWEGSITVPNGLYEYKVTLDNWNAQEAFAGTEECTKTANDFTNRLLLVSGNADLPKFCYNSCYACGEEVDITFKLGMNGITPNPEGVWLSGGGNFEIPGGRYKMKDPDGDGIFELSVPRKKGFKSYYTFANGPCADYSCKEILEGLPCGDPTNYNDRFLPFVTADTIVATCFQTCFTNAACTSGALTPTEDKSLFQLLGNPSQNNASVLLFGHSIATSAQVTLVNALGQLAAQFDVPQGLSAYELNTSALKPGIYLVTVHVGDRFLSRKLVK